MTRMYPFPDQSQPKFCFDVSPVIKNIPALSRSLNLPEIFLHPSFLPRRTDEQRIRFNEKSNIGFSFNGAKKGGREKLRSHPSFRQRYSMDIRRI